LRLTAPIGNATPLRKWHASGVDSLPLSPLAELAPVRFVRIVDNRPHIGKRAVESLHYLS
jgi:hypothetical protein